MANQSIINLNKMCTSALNAGLGGVLDEIYQSLQEGQPSSSELNEQQIALLNKMCTSAQKVQLGTLVSTIIASSTSGDPIDELTANQISLLNKMCISAAVVSDSNNSISGLGDLLSWCIEKINAGIQSSATNILTYSLGVAGENVQIQDNDSILITLPAESVIGSYTPTFTLSQGASASIDDAPQTSGVTQVDFGTAPDNTIQYEIAAQDGISSQLWNVTVEVAQQASQTFASVDTQQENSEDLSQVDNDVNLETEITE